MAKKKNHTTFDGHFTESMGVKPSEASLDQLNEYYGRISGDMKDLNPLNTWFMGQRRSAIARDITSDPETRTLAGREAKLRREAADPSVSRGKVAVRGRWVSPPTEGEYDKSVAKGEADYEHELKLAMQRVQEAQRAGAAQGMWPNVVDTRTSPPTRLVSPAMAERISRQMSGAAEPSWSPLDLVGGSGWGAAGLGAGGATLGMSLLTPQGRALARSGASKAVAAGRAMRDYGRSVKVQSPIRSPLYREQAKKPSATWSKGLRRNIEVKPGGSRTQLPGKGSYAAAKQRARAKAAEKKRSEAVSSERTATEKAAQKQAEAAVNKKSQQASINRGKKQDPKRLSRDKKGGLKSSVEKAKAPRVSEEQRAKELLPAFKETRQTLLKESKNPQNSLTDQANFRELSRLMDDWIVDASAGRVPKMTQKAADIAAMRSRVLLSPEMKKFMKDLTTEQAKKTASGNKAARFLRTKKGRKSHANEDLSE